MKNSLYNLQTLTIEYPSNNFANINWVTIVSCETKALQPNFQLTVSGYWNYKYEKLI